MPSTNLMKVIQKHHTSAGFNVFCYFTTCTPA